MKLICHTIERASVMGKCFVGSAAIACTRTTMMACELSSCVDRLQHASLWSSAPRASAAQATRGMFSSILRRNHLIDSYNVANVVQSAMIAHMTNLANLDRVAH